MPEGYRLGVGLSMFWLGITLLEVAGCSRPPSPASPRPVREQSQFQKVTGDDPDESRRQWDLLYSTQAYVYGKEPAAFLREKLGAVAVGRALDIAMGEGRNTVYLAKKGFQVLGVDLSEVAIRKAKLLAREQGSIIRTEVADLNLYQIPRESYDLIVNIQYLQRSLIPQIKAGLRRGGHVIFENPTVAEKERSPEKNLPRDFVLEKGELRRLFSDFEILSYSEGPGEGGEIVARLFARKR